MVDVQQMKDLEVNAPSATEIADMQQNLYLRLTFTQAKCPKPNQRPRRATKDLLLHLS